MATSPETGNIPLPDPKKVTDVPPPQGGLFESISNLLKTPKGMFAAGASAALIGTGAVGLIKGSKEEKAPEGSQKNTPAAVAPAKEGKPASDTPTEQAEKARKEALAFINTLPERGEYVVPSKIAEQLGIKANPTSEELTPETASKYCVSIEDCPQDRMMQPTEEWARINDGRHSVGDPNKVVIGRIEMGEVSNGENQKITTVVVPAGVKVPKGTYLDPDFTNREDFKGKYSSNTTRVFREVGDISLIADSGTYSVPAKKSHAPTGAPTTDPNPSTKTTAEPSTAMEVPADVRDYIYKNLGLQQFGNYSIPPYLAKGIKFDQPETPQDFTPAVAEEFCLKPADCPEGRIYQPSQMLANKHDNVPGGDPELPAIGRLELKENGPSTDILVPPEYDVPVVAYANSDGSNRIEKTSDYGPGVYRVFKGVMRMTLIDTRVSQLYPNARWQVDPNYREG